MDTLYEDIINALKTEKSLEPIKIKQNKYIKIVAPLVEELIKTFYTEQMILMNKNIDYKNLENIKTAKNVLIKKIKDEIQNINNEFHLRIDSILKNETINQKELQFALDILYENPIIEKQLGKIKEYRIEQGIMNNINYILNETQEKKQSILQNFKEIKKITNDKNQNKIKTIIKNINPKNNKEKEEKKQNIISAIAKTQKQFHDELKDECKEELNNLMKLKQQLENTKLNEQNRHKLKKQIIKQYEKIEINIIITLEKKKKEQSALRTSIKIPQQQLNEILYGNNKNYTFNMLQSSFKNNKNKKETLLAKSLLILKLINLIENNEVNILNELEERKKTI